MISAPEIWGVTHWGPDGVRLRVVIPTRPLRNWDVNRQLRERLKVAFDRAGIRMPVPIQEVAGTPGRRAVHTARTEPTSDEADADERPRFDPTSTERLEAETGWIDLPPGSTLRPDR